MGKLKVTVNHNRCVGSRLCVSFLPDVFDLDEEGQAIVTGIEKVTPFDIIQTAEQCPQSAIRVEDMETGEVLFPPADLEG